jgi:hypothetical protein
MTGAESVPWLREFAFSALQSFVIPGSCPNINTIDLQIFEPLNVLSNVEPKVQDVKFSFAIPANANTASWKSDYSGLSVVYINQQNTPIVQALQNIDVMDTTVTFTATFPFDEATFGNGLTIAAVTNSTGPFASVDDVAKATVFGPGLIEVN